MKHILIFVLMFISMLVNVRGESSKLPQKFILLYELKTILEKDGLHPQIKEDDLSLEFEYNGNSYLLELMQDKLLYFGRLSQFHEYGDKITRNVIDLFSRKYNYKIVKVLSAKTGYYLRIEFLLKDSIYFKDVYTRFLELLEQSNKTIIDNVPELIKTIDEEEFTISDLRLLTDVEDGISFVYPVVSFSAPNNQDKKYPVFLRLYCNNSLVQDDESPADFSCVDTIRTNNQSQPLFMKRWSYDSCDTTVLYRCELWREQQCLYTKSFNIK